MLFGRVAMRRELIRCVTVLFVLTFLFPALWTGEAQAADIKLRFAHHDPPNGPGGTSCAMWAKKVEEVTAGKVQITMYPAQALAKGGATYDAVISSVADVGWSVNGLYPGRFPLTDLLSLPFMGIKNSMAGSLALWNNYQKFPEIQKEYDDVKVLLLHTHQGAPIGTRMKAAKTLEDLKGMKLRSPGGHQTNYIKALGAEPIFMPLGDVYMAIETGTVDGIVTCPPLVVAFKLFEVAKYGALVTLGCVSEGTVMNLNVWDKLPEDQKKLVEELCSNPFRTSGGLTRAEYPKLMEEIQKGGVKLTEVPKAEAQRWYEQFQEVTRKWAADLEAKGLPAKKAVAIMNEECEKRGIELVACPPEFKKV
jgi:TRAP-type C4-dicarboxylate transport system substrate-binding protein